MGLVSFHHPMGLANVFEAEDARRLRIVAASGDVLSNTLKRHVRERKSRCSENEASEEGQIDAARHLQQRVEIRDRSQAAEPTGEASSTASAEHREGIENGAVANKIEHGINLLGLGD